MVWGTLRIHSPLPLMMIELPAGRGLGGINPSVQFAGLDQFPLPEKVTKFTTLKLIVLSGPCPQPLIARTDKLPPKDPDVTVIVLVLLLPVQPLGNTQL
jgi:hypothetical protein